MHAAYKADCQLFISKKGNKGYKKLNLQIPETSSFQNNNVRVTDFLPV